MGRKAVVKPEPVAAPPEEERLQTISPSQMDALDCRLKWHWAYRQGYRAKKRNINLSLGDGVHQALDVYYASRAIPRPGEKAKPKVSPDQAIESFRAWADREVSALNPTWIAEEAELKNAADLGVHMLRGYFDKYHDREPFEIICTEETIVRPIPIPGTDQPSPYHLVVRLDGLVRMKNSGQLFVLEHKTFSKFSLAHLERDHQFTAQFYCGQGLSIDEGPPEEVVGVIYNGLRKQAPGPKVRLALFERHFLYRTQRHVDVVLHRAYWQASMMFRDDVPIYPQPNSMRCGGCDFRGPCDEYQRGGDYQYILDQLFVSRAEREELEEED